jgi:preprotein translocase subunit SecG
MRAIPTARAAFERSPAPALVIRLAIVYERPKSTKNAFQEPSMATVILVVHLMIAAALVGVVLMQKSEGGALGMGGGGGAGGGFLTGRGTANLLTRATAALAAAFFLTSITLTIMANKRTGAPSVLDQTAPATSTSPSAGDKPAQVPAEGRGGILDKLQGGGGPQVPRSN